LDATVFRSAMASVRQQPSNPEKPVTPKTVQSLLRESKTGDNEKRSSRLSKCRVDTTPLKSKEALFQPMFRQRARVLRNQKTKDTFLDGTSSQKGTASVGSQRTSDKSVEWKDFPSTSSAVNFWNTKHALQKARDTGSSVDLSEQSAFDDAFNLNFYTSSQSEFVTFDRNFYANIVTQGAQ
jgi:hypothetical protein